MVTIPIHYIRDEGTDAFLSRLNEALPASEALIGLLPMKSTHNKIDGRARLTALALPKIAKIPASIYRSLMLDSLRDMSGKLVGQISMHDCKISDKQPFRWKYKKSEIPT